MEQMSFNFVQAQQYMAQMFGFEEQRDMLNTAISDARSIAREMGVPTKAIELAIRAERNHKKALTVVTQEEFDALRAAAVLVEMAEQAKELAENGASVL